MLNKPGLLISVAVFLMIFGVLMPFLMVIHTVESTFFLNFLSYAASVLGLFLGTIGFGMSQVKRKKRD